MERYDLFMHSVLAELPSWEPPLVDDLARSVGPQLPTATLMASRNSQARASRLGAVGSFGCCLTGGLTGSRAGRQLGPSMRVPIGLESPLNRLINVPVFDVFDLPGPVAIWQVRFW